MICGAGTVGTRLRPPAVGARRPARDTCCSTTSHGLIDPEREDLHAVPARLRPRATRRAPSAEGLRGADVFIGASAGGVAHPGDDPLDEPLPDRLRPGHPGPGDRATRRPAAAGATSSSAPASARIPNAIVDLLSFPYIFRGALDVQATRITEGMMLAAARALAELAREEVREEVSRAYGDESLHLRPGVPAAQADRPAHPRARVGGGGARRRSPEGVAGRRVDAEQLRGEPDRAARAPAARLMRQLILKARAGAPAHRLPGGDERDDPARLQHPRRRGDREPDPARHARRRCAAAAERAGTRPRRRLRSSTRPAARSRDAYAEEYFALRRRRGVTPDLAAERMLQPEYFARHDAPQRRRRHDDLAASPPTTPTRCAPILEVIGPAPGVRRISSLHMVLRPDGGLLPRRLRASTSSPTPRSWPRSRSWRRALCAVARHRAARGHALLLELRQRRSSVRAQGAHGDRDRAGAARPTSSSTARCS